MAFVLQDSNGQLWQLTVTPDGAVQTTSVISGTPTNLAAIDPISSLKGNDLYKMAMNRLAGYKNAVRADVLMDFINEGKDEVWMLLKQQNEEYFVTNTQTEDNTARNYLAPLSTSIREYALPSDFRGLKYIEVLSPVGYELVTFRYKKLSDPDFRSARAAATSDGGSGYSSGEYYYTIVNGNTLMLANFPEVPFTLRIWYVKSLPDIDQADSISGILDPFVKKIAEYAVRKVILGTQDTKMWETWKAEWKDSVVNLMMGAGPENQADPVFVEDFVG